MRALGRHFLVSQALFIIQANNLVKIKQKK